MAEIEEIDNEELESQPKKDNKKLIFIIAGAAVGVGALVGALFFFGVIGSKGGGEGDAPPKVEIQTPKKEARPTVPLKEFIVNLADTEQARYLKAVVELEVANEEIKEACEKNMAAIRNSLVELLTSKTHAQVRDIKGKTRLRQEVIVRLNEILGTNGITQVYFTDFIVQ